MPGGGAGAERRGPQGSGAALHDAVTMDAGPRMFVPTAARPARRENPHGHGGLEWMTMYRYQLITATM